MDWFTSTDMDERNALVSDALIGTSTPWRKCQATAVLTSSGDSPPTSLLVLTTARAHFAGACISTITLATKRWREERGSDHGTELDPTQLSAAQDHHSCTHSFYVNKTLVPLNPSFHCQRLFCILFSTDTVHSYLWFPTCSLSPFLQFFLLGRCILRQLKVIFLHVDFSFKVTWHLMLCLYLGKPNKKQHPSILILDW